MFYAQVTPDGICNSVTETHGEISGEFIIPIDSYDLDLLGKRWNGKSFESVLYEAPVYTKLTRKAFLKRFTDAEAIAIDLASIGATVEAASLRRYLNLVNASIYIDLKDEETIKGVQALEYAGILGKGRAQEILETPVTDQERYTAQG